MEVTPITPITVEYINTNVGDHIKRTETNTKFIKMEHSKPDGYKNIQTSSLIPVDITNESYITSAMKYLGLTK
jgi:hypothetical protein